MKSTRALAFAGSIAALVFSYSAQAEQYSAGNITWDNGTAVGWGPTGGPYTSTWTSGDDAVFEGSGSPVVSIAPTGATAHNLTFSTGGYTIQDNTLTLSGAGPTFTTSAGTATISSALVGVNGATYNKLGSGTLILSGNNSSLLPNVDFNLANLNVNGGGKLAITAGLTRLAATISLTRTIGTMDIGGSSANNTLEVSGTGQLITEKTRIGYGTDGGNKMTVSTPGNNLSSANYSVWSVGSGETGVNGSMVIGGSSSSNALEISNGAYYYVNNSSTATWTLGLNSGANANSIKVTGSSSGNPSTLYFSANQVLNVGQAGSNNTLEVSNGAFIRLSRLGVGDGGGSGNSATIKGTGAANSATITMTGTTNNLFEIGSGTGADNNFVSVQAGGVLNITGSGTTRNYSIGGKGQQNAQTAGGNSNYLEVTGATSAFNMTAGLPLVVGGTATGAGPGTVTDGGNNNRIDISSGATMTLTNTSLYVLGSTSSGNTSVNLGNGTGISTLAVGATANYTAGVLLNNANGRLNFNSGRLIAGANGALVSGAGKVDLLGAAYVSTALTNTISTEITGVGSLTKEGVGTLDLSYLNTYTGDTLVNAGTLQMENAYLADGAAVRMITGGVLNLNTAGATDTIAAFYIDDVLQPGGTWGSQASAATNKSDFFTPGSTGMLFVGVIPEPAAALLGGLGLLSLLRRRRGA